MGATIVCVFASIYTHKRNLSKNGASARYHYAKRKGTTKEVATLRATRQAEHISLLSFPAGSFVRSFVYRASISSLYLQC